MILNTTTKSLEVVLGEVIATTNPVVLATYADITANTFLPGASDTAANGTVNVTVVTAPTAANTQRQVKYLNIYNADTIDHFVFVVLNDNGTRRTLERVSVASLKTLTWTPEGGWSVLLSAPVAISEGGTGATTAAGARTNLGLGTIATQDANAVAITGGSITGITDLAVADGGTGASTAAGARTNLGLGSIATQDASNVTITGGSLTGLTSITLAAAGTILTDAGTAAAPALLIGEAATGFYKSAAGATRWVSSTGVTGSDYIEFGATANSLKVVKTGGGANFSATGETGITGLFAIRYDNVSAAAGGAFDGRRARGTIASPTVILTSDQMLSVTARGYDGAAFQIGATQDVLCTDTSPSSTAMGSAWRLRLCAIGSVSLSEVARFDNASGFMMFGSTNIAIGPNRLFYPRSTTIAGQITPATAGRVGYFSDAQGGAGSLVLDTGTAYRLAGQGALKRLTTDANITYTPVADGRIIRDLAALTANRKLTMAITNVTDGHEALVTRRGSSGGFTRDVYQADGTTLIVSIADNANARIIYDATAALWFQA